MSEIRVSRALKITGEYQPPGDKSISHRALILGALAEGKTKISGLLEAEDVINTLKIMRQLGADIEHLGDGDYLARGGKNALKEPGDILDAGNSGTGIRLISGILASLPFFSVITGDESIRKRPMKRIVEPLKRMGAVIEGREQGNLPPLAISGGDLKGITFDSPSASAQVKSCLLLAGLNAEGVTRVVEPTKSRDHSERMLTGFGATINIQGNEVGIQGGQVLKGCEVDVPADISSAAFFIAMGLLLPDSELKLKNIGVNPTRTGIIEALKRAGADIQVINERVSGGEPRADLIVRSSNLKGMNIDGEIIPKLIDEIPILGVLACFAEGVTVIKDAEELRVKESDRLATLTAELRKMGAVIEEKPDGLIIEGVKKLKGAVCESHGDHRIAMAIAVAGLMADGETVIQNTACVSTSFPSFEADMRKLIKF